MNNLLGRSKRAITLCALTAAALAALSPEGHAAAPQGSELLLFCAEWSPSCEHDRPLFEQKLPDALKDAKLDVRVRVIDADTNPELLKRYKVEYVPAVFIQTRDHKVHEFLDERLEQPIVSFAKRYATER